jgi:16S rRNA (guanine527-N7)-methyltransferase
LDVHRDVLERWRTKMNLVGPGPIEVHYADAREALTGITPVGRWADLGTGAGFPGVVLAALFPEIAVDLVDSRQKRCIFLEEVIGRAVATGVQVLNQRIETLPDAIYDGITARALTAPAGVVELGRRLLRPGGQVVLFLQADAPTPSHDGFDVVSEHRYAVEAKSRRSVVLRLRDGSPD